jgi:predicted DNA-binding WGR domain protein
MTGHPPAQTVQLLVLDRIDPAQNMARYYVLSIEPAFFDQVALVREWGRSGKPGGRRIELHASIHNARVALETWLKRKMTRGYRPRSGRQNAETEERSTERRQLAPPASFCP